MNSILGNFLIFCSGASKKILATCPETEHIKYIGLGGTILFTSLFAVLSSHFAAFIITKDEVLSWSVGILWGLMIFNLDRYLISSIRKYRSSMLSTAIPRIILGLFIAFTLAHPIELRIFEGEIKEYMSALKFSQKDDIKNKYADAVEKHNLVRERNIKNISVKPEIENLKKQLSQYAKEKSSLELVINKSKKNYVCECDGSCGTGTSGDGPECKRKKGLYFDDKLKSESINQKISVAMTKINDLQAQEEEEIRLENGEYDKKAQKEEKKKNSNLAEHELVFSDSIYSRSRAFYQLVEEDDLYVFVTLIFLLFVLLEITPIIAKLMQPIGTYDILLATEIDKANKIKKEISNGIKSLDLSNERSIYSNLIKSSISEIISHWASEFDKNKHTNAVHNNFKNLNNSFFSQGYIDLSAFSLKSSYSIKRYDIFLKVVYVFVVSLTTLIPYIYFIKSYSADTAATISLTAGMFTMTLIMLFKVSKERQAITSSGK